jgi:hypothetical protein
MQQEPYFDYKDPIMRCGIIKVPIFLEDGPIDGFETINFEYYTEDDTTYITYIEDYGDAHPDDVNMMLWYKLGRHEII